MQFQRAKYGEKGFEFFQVYLHMKGIKTEKENEKKKAEN